MPSTGDVSRNVEVNALVALRASSASAQAGAGAAARPGQHPCAVEVQSVAGEECDCAAPLSVSDEADAWCALPA